MEQHVSFSYCWLFYITLCFLLVKKSIWRPATDLILSWIKSIVSQLFFVSFGIVSKEIFSTPASISSNFNGFITMTTSYSDSFYMSQVLSLKFWTFYTHIHCNMTWKCRNLSCVYYYGARPESELNILFSPFISVYYLLQYDIYKICNAKFADSKNYWRRCYCFPTILIENILGVLCFQEPSGWCCRFMVVGWNLHYFNRNFQRVLC